MARFKLLPYRVRIKNNSTRTYQNLNNIPTANGSKSFSEIFINFCKHHQNIAHINSNAKKTMIIDNYSALNNNYLFQGIIKAGEHGYCADFYNINTGARTKDARREEHSEEMPFFFLIHTSLNQN